MITVTPARRVLSRLAIDGVRTPEHLVPALGGGLSPNNDEAASEGIFRVYERRTSEQPAKISNRAKTCPQLRGSSTRYAWVPSPLLRQNVPTV